MKDNQVNNKRRSSVSPRTWLPQCSSKAFGLNEAPPAAEISSSLGQLQLRNHLAKGIPKPFFRRASVSSGNQSLIACLSNHFRFPFRNLKRLGSRRQNSTRSLSRKMARDSNDTIMLARSTLVRMSSGR